MQDLRITLVQIDQAWEDKEENFNRYKRQLQDVETDLIVLPEMFQTGFSMNVEQLGEDWRTSKSLEWLKELAKEKTAAIYTSFIIKEEEHYFNRGVFVFPEGEVEYYNKRKSFGLAGEDKFFTAGQSEKIIEYKKWKIQLQICYDLRFPEIVRNVEDENGGAKYDIILYVANWPDKRVSHWDTLLSARAIENQSYVVGVNRVGEDQNGLVYSGHSYLVDPLGYSQMLESHQITSKTFVISSNFLSKTRKTLPFLRDR